MCLIPGLRLTYIQCIRLVYVLTMDWQGLPQRQVVWLLQEQQAQYYENIVGPNNKKVLKTQQHHHNNNTKKQEDHTTTTHSVVAVGWQWYIFCILLLLWSHTGY